MISIRTCSPKDISLITYLIRCSFKDVAARFGLTPSNCPTHPSNYTDQRVISDLEAGIQYFILENNRLPCGCVAMEKANSKIVYLERLAVLPEQRHHGYGKALIDRIIEESKTLGAVSIGIAMIAKQTELKSWYRKMGFIGEETKRFNHLPFAVSYMTLSL